MLHEELTSKIIKCFYNVYNSIGHGFPEKVYENAFCIELEEMGLNFERQKKIPVFYKGKAAGHFYADIVVEGKVILELKAVEKLLYKFEIQLLNYLRASSAEVGFVFNFGDKAKFKRKVYSHKKMAVHNL